MAAAIEAGIALGVLGDAAVTDRMIRLAAEDGIADLPVSHLVFEYGRGDIRPEVAAMAQAIRRAVEQGTD